MRFFIAILSCFFVTGCASTPVYNPMQVATQQEILLNESGFKAIQEGMTLDQIHQIMGIALVIGYEEQPPDYKPLTVPNPYKTQTINGTDYQIEYYIESIRQPDGVVSDDELLPLVFKDGKLVGRGWPLANSLQPKI